MNDTANSTDNGYYVQETLHRKILGTIIFVSVWPFVVLDFKCFPLGRPAAALIGAALMAIFIIVPQGQVYYVIGELGNMQTLFLLLGMMILSYYYDREGLLTFISLKIFGHRKPFSRILWKVCVLSAVLSAIITNDATCLVITPLLLNEHQKQKRSHKEILPMLLGIATSANIGSAATFFGNPQNAYIAANANISLIIFFTASMPGAIIGLSLSIGLLYLLFIRTIFFQKSEMDVESPLPSGAESHTVCHKAYTNLSTSRRELAQSFDCSQNPFLTSQIAEERSKHYAGYNQTEHVKAIQKSSSREETMGSRSLPADLRYSCMYDQDVNKGQVLREETNFSCGDESELMGLTDSHREDTMTKPLANGNHVPLPLESEETPLVKSNTDNSFRARYKKVLSKIFIGWLVIITIVMVGLLTVPPLPSVKFNLGLVPMGAAIMTMLADTILNGTYSFDAMTKIDWTVILLFGGLFVWLQGFENTGFTQAIFNKIKKAMNLSKIEGILVFTVFVVIGSNILSNVPLVVLLSPELGNFVCGGSESGLCSTQLSGLLLAWVSTIAGNFTLIGSVANLIVAEKARNTIGYRLTFLEYFKFGFISTLVVLFSGLPIIYFAANGIRF